MSNLRRLALLVLALFIMVVYQSTALAAANQNNKMLSPLASRNFWELNNAFTIYQEAAKNPWPIIPDEPHILKRGKKSDVVPVLRERLKITGDLPADDDHQGRQFDDALEAAVMVFQARHGIKPDGVVGDNTRFEMNVPPEVRIKQIAINMQRWADLANKLGDRFVMVNIPDFNLYLIDDGKRVLEMRAIVGKPDLPTPEISSKITQLEFNPYWNIPPTIAKRDIAPKMIEDPDYVYKNHIRAFAVEGDDSSQVSPRHIDWYRAAEEGVNYHLRQDPGTDNALGRVKFVFQNTKDVYLHDTPAKNLFSMDIRSFSHGCVRLENPFALVDYLMKDNPEWSQERMQEILDSGENKYVKVPHPISIFITYITAWVDEDGRVNFRDDLYQLDDPDAPHTDPDADGNY